MSGIEKAQQRPVAYRLRLVLMADAAWDGVLGVVFCLASTRLLAGWDWFPMLRPWPLFVIVGAGCLAFAVVLVRSGRDPNAEAFARLVAIGNVGAAVAAGLAAVFLNGSTPTTITLATVAIGCAIFAALEYRPASRRD